MSNYVLLDVLGVMRWAERTSKGFEVDEMYLNGTYYGSYTKTTGKVVWDVKQRGRHPSSEEFDELEARLA